MDKILEELAAIRSEQAKKHEELTKKLGDNYKKDADLLKKLQDTLDGLKTELQSTKEDFSRRIKSLEENTVKISDIDNIRKILSSEAPADAAQQEKLQQIANRLEFLEKESRRNKISIAGLILSSKNRTEEVRLFLNSKFNIECTNISIKEFSKRIIVDLFDPSLKQDILRTKKERLAGTSIFID